MGNSEGGIAGPAERDSGIELLTHSLIPCGTINQTTTRFKACEYYNWKPSTLKTDLERHLRVRCLEQSRVKSRGNENLRGVFNGYRLV